MSEDLLPIEEIKNPKNLKPQSLSEYLETYAGFPVSGKPSKQKLLEKFTEIQSKYKEWKDSPEGLNSKDKIKAFRDKFGSPSSTANNTPSRLPPPATKTTTTIKKRDRSDTEKEEEEEDKEQSKTKRRKVSASSEPESSESEHDGKSRQKKTTTTKKRTTSSGQVPLTFSQTQSSQPYLSSDNNVQVKDEDLPKNLPSQSAVKKTVSTTKESHQFQPPSQPNIPSSVNEVSFMGNKKPSEELTRIPSNKQFMEDFPSFSANQANFIPLYDLILQRDRILPPAPPEYQVCRDIIRTAIETGETECSIALAKDKLKLCSYNEELRIGFADDVTASLLRLIHYDRLNVYLSFSCEEGTSATWLQQGGWLFRLFAPSKQLNFDLMLQSENLVIDLLVDLNAKIPENCKLITQPYGISGVKQYYAMIYKNRWALPIYLFRSEEGEKYFISNVDSTTVQND